MWEGGTVKESHTETDCGVHSTCVGACMGTVGRGVARERAHLRTQMSAYSDRSAMPVSEKPMTPPALKAVLNESVHPTVGLHAPTVQRALEKTATRMPMKPQSIEVTAPTTNDRPESRPVGHAHDASLVLSPHAMSTDSAGKTTTTKRAHSLYSAFKNELAPIEMAL